MIRLFLTVLCAGSLTYFAGFQLWNLGLFFQATSGFWASGMLILAIGFFSRVFRLE